MERININRSRGRFCRGTCYAASRGGPSARRYYSGDARCRRVSSTPRQVASIRVFIYKSLFICVMAFSFKSRRYVRSYTPADSPASVRPVASAHSVPAAPLPLLRSQSATRRSLGFRGSWMFSELIGRRRGERALSAEVRCIINPTVG